jgi:hypothetical protein
LKATRASRPSAILELALIHTPLVPEIIWNESRMMMSRMAMPTRTSMSVKPALRW